MIVWVIAGLLGLATGLRIGWALVNQQSVVSSGMIVALGSLGALAALNWPPLTLLVDRALHWPNISIAISEVALIFSAAGSCVMITSVASSQRPKMTRVLAVTQYSIASVTAAIAVALFLTGDRQPEMKPREYLERNLGTNTALPWLVPLLYILLALTLACWVGIRLSNASRRGRALFLFTAGIALIVAASAFTLIRALGTNPLIGVGTAATLLIAAMAIVAAGSLLPSGEDWVGARRELRLIRPLQREMIRRHPDVGIGVRPRGPLVFRVAERLSLISDAIYLEAIEFDDPDDPDNPEVEEPESPRGISTLQQARAVARWIRAGRGGDSAAAAAAFPGRGWLRQPEDCSDREWILEIARQYRLLGDRPDTPDETDGAAVAAGRMSGPATEGIDKGPEGEVEEGLEPEMVPAVVDEPVPVEAGVETLAEHPEQDSGESDLQPLPAPISIASKRRAGGAVASVDPADDVIVHESTGPDRETPDASDTSVAEVAEDEALDSRDAPLVSVSAADEPVNAQPVGEESPTNVVPINDNVADADRVGNVVEFRLDRPRSKRSRR